MKDAVRVSMGTLRVLGLEVLETFADPTTAYLQTYHPGRCNQACGFCAQARCSSASKENIARGLYPERDTAEVVSRLTKAYAHNLLKRCCIQTMNYEGMLEDLLFIVSSIRKESEIPISVSIFPIPKADMKRLRKAGANQLIIPLDACTEKIFDELKGEKAGCSYRWGNHLAALSEAVSVFGKKNVGTHLIIGLGEKEEEAASTIQMLAYLGVYPALFAYTPITGSSYKGKEPKIGHYRRIQMASHLISNQLTNLSRMIFDKGRILDYGIDDEYLEGVISSGEAFRTSGCADCNRPYSTESPGKTIYNYPRPLTKEETEDAFIEMEEGL